MLSLFLFFFFSLLIFVSAESIFPKEVPGGDWEPKSLPVSCGNSHPCNFGFSPWICPWQLYPIPWEEERAGSSATHSAKAPMGSHAGRTMGSCSKTASTSSGTCFLSTTTS